MTETSSSHEGEERAFHAAPRGSQHGPMQDSMDDFTTAEALDIFSDKLERALRRQKQEIVNELNLTSKSTEKKSKEKKHHRKPYERNNRSYSGQDSQGLPGQFFRPHGQDFGSSFTRAEYGRYPYYQPYTSSQQWYRKAASSSSGSSGAAARNICFYCNKFGQWANKCPEKGNGSFTNTAPATASGSNQ
uniref:CCHC-type domain-containing protein n=1 Tax=Magallana gigas TaxID=29159 RepID=A0A8W8LZ15_MAGGI